MGAPDTTPPTDTTDTSPAAADAADVAAIDTTVQASLEASRRMLRTTDESQRAAAQTMVALKEQGEALNRIERGGAHIDRTLRENERQLSIMEKCCYCCVYCCGWGVAKPDTRPLPEGRKPFAPPAADAVITQQPVSGIAPVPTAGTSLGIVDGAPVPYTLPVEPPAQFRRLLPDSAVEAELERNMDEVGRDVEQLREQAAVIGHELDAQNEQLARLNIATDQSNARMWAVTQRAYNIR